MSEREQALWRRGITPIVSKYQEEHKKVMSEIAGRGFSALPGYAYDIENRIELNTKINLSELNFKILSETTEREIKQAGIDYNSDYKTVLMAWEIEKQALMAAWDSELAGIKLGMVREEEALDRLAIEVGHRSITLLEQKTALELQMEDYRKTLAELDAATSPYDVQLANAKLLTAQKKLEIIPILEGIVAKEQELLVAEQEKAAAYTDLIDAENQISIKKKDLIEPYGELINKTEELIEKSGERIDAEKLIAEEKIKQSAAEVTKSGYKVEELLAEAEVQEKRITLVGEKRELEGIKFDHAQDLVDYELRKDREYQRGVETTHDDIMNQERAVQSTIISNKTTVHTVDNTTRKESASRISSAEVSANHAIASREASADTRIADIKAAAKITSQLRHLIGA